MIYTFIEVFFQQIMITKMFSTFLLQQWKNCIKFRLIVVSIPYGLSSSLRWKPARKPTDWRFFCQKAGNPLVGFQVKSWKRWPIRVNEMETHHLGSRMMTHWAKFTKILQISSFLNLISGGFPAFWPGNPPMGFPMGFQSKELDSPYGSNFENIF